MTALAPIGRVLFSLIFILSFPHLLGHDSVVAAHNAGVPLAQVAVPVAGIIALLGGLSILLGFYARIGAILLFVFLVPVTLFMHRFWGVADPHMHQMQMTNFIKNVALIGGTLFFMYAGAGPVSIDARTGGVELHHA
jgi:putative oxidoreductase